VKTTNLFTWEVQNVMRVLKLPLKYFLSERGNESELSQVNDQNKG
jgi:hypothetical protein